MSYTVGLKTSISYVVSHHCVRIKIDSDDDLPLEIPFRHTY